MHGVAERNKWIEDMMLNHKAEAAEAIKKGNQMTQQLHNLDRKINDSNKRTDTIDARLNDRTKPVCINNTCIDENQLKKLVGLLDGKQHFELGTYYGKSDTNVHCAYGAGPNMAVHNKDIGCQGDKLRHHRWHLRLL